MIGPVSGRAEDSIVRVARLLDARLISIPVGSCCSGDAQTFLGRIVVNIVPAVTCTGLVGQRSAPKATKVRPHSEKAATVLLTIKNSVRTGRVRRIGCPPLK